MLIQSFPAQTYSFAKVNNASHSVRFGNNDDDVEEMMSVAAAKDEALNEIKSEKRQKWEKRGKYTGGTLLILLLTFLGGRWSDNGSQTEAAGTIEQQGQELTVVKRQLNKANQTIQDQQGQIDRADAALDLAKNDLIFHRDNLLPDFDDGLGLLFDLYRDEQERRLNTRLPQLTKENFFREFGDAVGKLEEAEQALIATDEQ
jgi:hypothetical protein